MDNNNGRKRKKRKGRVKNSVKIVFLLLFLVISGTAGFFVAKARVTFNQTLNHVKRDYNSKLSSVDLSGIKVKSDNDIVNILLIGNDRRDEKYYSNKRGLTDVIIIATIISILIGSSISTIKIKKNGILNGGIIGCIYILGIYLVSSVAQVGFALNMYSIIMIILSILAGMIGGIVGVNIKK